MLKEQQKKRGGINKMKKKDIIGNGIAKAAYKKAEKSNDLICSYIFYQPKLPEAVKKLKKTNDK